MKRSTSKKVRYSYKDWLAYFRANDGRRLKIDFGQEPKLSKKARKLIFPSISAFQMGEHSDGNYLYEIAEEFGRTHKEPYYAETMVLFTKEENFHSSYLAQYMNYHKEPLAKKNKLDEIFRKLRHNGSLFTEIAILVTAESVALSYYSALGNVADEIGSQALRSICNQMLHDELPHIIFQSYTLSHFHNGFLKKLYRILAMELTTVAVYTAYGKVLKRGGYEFKRFRSENTGYLKQSFSIIRKQSGVKK